MTVNNSSFKKKVTAGTMAGMLAIACPFIAAKEGVSLTPYQDIGGVWTICHGETAGVRVSQKETLESCSMMLSFKLRLVGLQVNNLVDPDMSDSRWAGLTSFTYNLGVSSFKNSTLRKKLNAGDPKACDEIMRWVYIGKKDCRLAANKCSGIVARRALERELCLRS